MENTPTENGPMPAKLPRKGCTINIMFPVKDDAFALKVKAAIDDVVDDIKEKRYTFSISEV